MVIEPSLPERCLRAGGCKKSGVAEEKHASDKDMYFLTSPGAFGSVWREPKIRKISGAFCPLPARHPRGTAGISPSWNLMPPPFQELRCHPRGVQGGQVPAGWYTSRQRLWGMVLASRGAGIDASRQSRAAVTVPGKLTGNSRGQELTTEFPST